jgi:ATP-dependent RNA helicase RhlE
MNFSELNIIPPLLKALDKQEFTTPTEIQEKVIPYAIK